MNGTYYKAHIENMKLRKNRDRYKRLKENIQDLETETVLKFHNPTPEELKLIRRKIFEDVRKTSIRNKRIAILGLVLGGLVFYGLCVLLVKVYM